MSGLGVHFSLSVEEVERLRSITDEQERLVYLQRNIEQTYFDEHPELKAESDNLWDAMHRVLSDGELTWEGGEYPLNHAVLAGERFYTGSDYIMSLKSTSQVREVAAALPSITEAEFRRRYFAINQKSYDAELSEEDLEEAWEWFQGVRDLYVAAAKAGRCVLFTAEQ